MVGDQAWWLTPAIPRWETERIVVRGDPRQKVGETPSQGWYGNMCMSSQQHRKHKQEDHDLKQVPCKNSRPYPKNY